jgi:endonuclease-3
MKDRARLVFRALSKLYPDAHCELDFKNPLQLLMATILSAQCTDVRVNLVTKELFKRCKNAKDFQNISALELEKIIHSTGFFRQKTKSIKGAASIMVKKYNGEVPSTLDELVELPGVGRKTANVILGNAFNLPGLPVDTHVKRLSNRIGLTTNSDPVKIELDLNQLIPPKDWCMMSHLLIWHGRRVCGARKPKCEMCVIRKECNYGINNS